MGMPIKKQIFVDIGESKLERQNFQGYLFKDLDFSNREEPISFLRCDFRGVKVENVQFYESNFNRSDFFDSYISNTSFYRCYFGTDFTNTVFFNVDFNKNEQETCAFFNCHFINCIFNGEKVTGTTNRNSKYKACSFTNCSYEENTFYDLDFENCTLINMNLAEMGAHGFTFSSCKFEGVTIDPDYLGSYLVKNSNIQDFSYSYRGYNFELTGNLKEDLKALSKHYYKNKRYHEALNSSLLFLSYSEHRKSIVPFFEEILNSLTKTFHSIFLYEQLSRIIKILRFYFNSPVLPIEECFYLIGRLEKIEPQFDDISEKLKYRNELNFIKDLISLKLFEEQDLTFINRSSLVYTEMEIEEDKYQEFEYNLKLFFDAIVESDDEVNGGNAYKIIGSRRGSLIIEVIGNAIGIYSLVLCAKAIITTSFEIIMEYRIQKRTTKLLLGDDAKELRSWSNKVKIARNIQKRPSEEVYKRSRELLSLIKSMRIFPNTFFKDREDDT